MEILIGLLILAAVIYFPVKAMKKKDAQEEQFANRIESADIYVREQNLQVAKKIVAADNSVALYLDADHQKFMVATQNYIDFPIYDFSDLISYQVVQDGTETGNASAVLGGGILFGTVGALAAASATQGTQKSCSDLHIDLNLNDLQNPRRRIDFITVETQTETPQFAEKMECLRDIVSALEYIKANAKRSASVVPSEQLQKIESLQPKDGYDELERLHDLKEKGIITEDEFQKKKKSILGL